jgi:hypothetical protein
MPERASNHNDLFPKEYLSSELVESTREIFRHAQPFYREQVGGWGVQYRTYEMPDAAKEVLFPQTEPQRHEQWKIHKLAELAIQDDPLYKQHVKMRYLRQDLLNNTITLFEYRKRIRRLIDQQG